METVRKLRRLGTLTFVMMIASLVLLFGSPMLGAGLRQAVNQAELQVSPSGAWVRLASRWAAWFG